MLFLLLCSSVFCGNLWPDAPSERAETPPSHFLPTPQRSPDARGNDTAFLSVDSLSMEDFVLTAARLPIDTLRELSARFRRLAELANDASILRIVGAKKLTRPDLV